MRNKIKAAYLRVRQWCKDSEALMIARAQVALGFLTAALSAMDWSPLLGAVGVDTGMSFKQTFWIGVVMCAKGLLDEAARRYRATDLK